MFSIFLHFFFFRNFVEQIFCEMPEPVDENASTSSSVGLKKNLGVAGCVSYIVQLIIGSGIFIMPNVSIKMLSLYVGSSTKNRVL